MPVITRPWGFYCCEEGDRFGFARLKGKQWAHAPLEGLRGDGRAAAAEALLPGGPSLPPLTRDAVFLEALRDAALLVSLDPEASLRCKIRGDQRALAEAAVFDLYRNALPRLHFLPFAAGTQAPPAREFRLLLLTELPEGEFAGARVDFTAAQPSLQLNFPRLHFAQRTLRALLPPLGLGVLLSMFNAAGRAVEEALGTQKAAQYDDLAAWLMLRRNFSANEYAITEAEHAQLERRAAEYESAL